ncbi:phosphotransferase [Actinokineospora sp. 24-640]
MSATDNRTERALAAATAAGRALGIESTDPTVLHDVFSVVVHLAPAPVVVRVPTVLAPSSRPHVQAERQRAELAVAAWLAEIGFPVVPPSPLVPREPVARDGFMMTFWQWVPTLATEPDYLAQCAESARLHAALRDYPGELPFMTSMDESVTDSLDRVAERPDLLPADDLARARAEWAALRPVLTDRAAFAEAFPEASVQPIHGDSPAYNLLHTADGPLFSDFELVTAGPVEWDLALMPPDHIAAYDERATALGLRATDPRAQKVMDAARMLQVVSCLALVPQLPVLTEGLAPSLAHWRTMPFAGDLV